MFVDHAGYESPLGVALGALWNQGQDIVPTVDYLSGSTPFYNLCNLDESSVVDDFTARLDFHRFR